MTHAFTVLVTGFEPFGGDAENASWESVRELPSTWQLANAELRVARLPVVFDAVGPSLEALVAEHSADLVVAVGEAGGRLAITPESTAHNAEDARIPDNAGKSPQGTIDVTRPELLPASIDCAAIVRAIAAVGVNAEISDDAGRFVCNRVAWWLAADATVPGVFIHVPAIRSAGEATVGSETDVPKDHSAAPSRPPSISRPHPTKTPPTIEELRRGVQAAVENAVEQVLQTR
ncbi:pyroglutamyl-peptidase I [Humidisolicoccus flavus]|uniref:pyroglutamyl-peptidase I family protein n=1 Tax=Humidisolicoccus flavus TaxID=3111414 RepID=UPI0032475DA7